MNKFKFENLTAKQTNKVENAVTTENLVRQKQ